MPFECGLVTPSPCFIKDCDKAKVVPFKVETIKTIFYILLFGGETGGTLDLDRRNFFGRGELAVFYCALCRFVSGSYW